MFLDYFRKNVSNVVSIRTDGHCKSVGLWESPWELDVGLVARKLRGDEPTPLMLHRALRRVGVLGHSVSSSADQDVECK